MAFSQSDKNVGLSRPAAVFIPLQTLLFVENATDKLCPTKLLRGKILGIHLGRKTFLQIEYGFNWRDDMRQYIKVKDKEWVPR